MLPHLVAKFVATFCLILQAWGGCGLGGLTICIRTGESCSPAMESTCRKKCCQRADGDHAATPSALRLRCECCVKVPLPDQPTGVDLLRRLDRQLAAAISVDVVGTSPSFLNEPDVLSWGLSPPVRHSSRLAICLASTRLLI